MKLSEVKQALLSIESLTFLLPEGIQVPAHFHITEVGMITRHFIDCGGKERLEKKINFQLWEAGDYDHRLAPQKLAKIIDLAIDRLGLGDLDVEVEYQRGTIGKYNLGFDGQNFLLQASQTACLAQENCGIPEEKLKQPLASLTQDNSTCTPGGGCC